MNNVETKLNNEDRTVCEVWTRVMGYYRPTSAFNKGKQSEYSDRVCFTESKAKEESAEKNEDNLKNAA